MIKGNFINTPRGFFHYHALGQGEKKIFFSHGSSLSGGTYLPFLELLPQHGFKVLAGDLRGHGFSTKVKVRDIDGWTIFIKDLAVLVESIAEPPVIGMGHSLGGFIAYAAASLYPHLFSKLVLIDPVVFPKNIVWLAAMVRRMGMSDRFTLAKMTRSKKNEFASHKEAFLHYRGKGMFADWGEEFVRAYVDTAIEQDATDSYALCCDPEFEARIYEQVPVNTWSYAPGIKMPTLILRGENSDLFHRSAARNLEKKIPNAKLIEMNNLGHFLIMENPEKVLEAVLPFIRD